MTHGSLFLEARLPTLNGRPVVQRFLHLLQDISRTVLLRSTANLACDGRSRAELHCAKLFLAVPPRPVLFWWDFTASCVKDSCGGMGQS